MADKAMRNRNRKGSSPSKKSSTKLSPEERALIHKAVDKVVDQYGETLRMLGQE